VKLILSALLGMAMCANVYAYTWSKTTTVKVVEASYIPAIVTFQVTDHPSDCINTLWLTWATRGKTETQRIANANGIYASLMAAQALGRTITIFGSSCNVEFINLN